MLSGLPPGGYRVSCSAAGFVEVREEGTVVQLPRKSPLEIKVRPGLMEIAGIVVNERGDPVPGALVLIAGERLPGPSRFRRARAGEDGHFAFPGLPSGTYQLKAYAPGLKGDPVEVEPGIIDDIVIVLTSAATPEDSEAGTVTFRLRFENSVPSTSFLEVSFCREGGPCRLRAAPIAAGAATFKGIQPGIYHLIVSPYGFAPVVISEIRLPARQPISVDLVPAPTWPGIIRTPRSQRFKSLMVYDDADHMLRKAVVDPDGAFWIHGLPAGEYLFRARDEHGSTWTSGSFVLVGKEEEIVLDMLVEDPSKK